MASSLHSDDILSASEATERFTSEKGLVLLRPGRSCCTPLHFIIPSGCYALVSRHGVDEEFIYPDGTYSIVWPAGLHFGYPPSVRVSSLVTQQTIVLDLPVKSCKTKDGVSVNVESALAFRIMGDSDAGEDPRLVRIFIVELDTRGLEQQLREAQETAVRELVGSLIHTEIYGMRSKQTKNIPSFGESIDHHANREEGMYLTEYIQERLNRQFSPRGVEVLSVMIQSCCLPNDIETQLEGNIKDIIANEEHRIIHENNLQNNLMEEEIITLKQTFEKQRQQEERLCAEQINGEKVKLRDAIAEAEKSRAAIVEEGITKIERLKVESDLEIQRIINRKNETIATMKDESVREASYLLSLTRLEVDKKIATASVTAAKNLAEACRLLSRAEGIVSPYLAKKKEHETKLRQLDVYRNLAGNENLILCDSDDSDTNILAIADSILSDSDCKNQLSRSSVIAELSIMNKITTGVFGQNR